MPVLIYLCSNLYSTTYNDLNALYAFFLIFLMKRIRQPTIKSITSTAQYNHKQITKSVYSSCPPLHIFAGKQI